MENTGISFRKFVNEIADPKIKKEINVAGVLGYILAAINLVVAILVNPIGIIDVCLITGFTLGIHIGKSRVCAVLFLIYGGINFIMLTVQYGKPAGYWGFAIGICAVIELFKAHKQYKAYINSGTI